MDRQLRELMSEVPSSFTERFVELVERIDPFCAAHLNDEYQGLCRKLAMVVCQEGSPVLRGKAESWAAAIVYAVGRVNFLTDPGQSPHMTTKQIAAGMGVSVSNMQAKYSAIWRGLDLRPFHPDLSLRCNLERNPLVWMLEVNGLLVDIRHAPRGAQVAAYEQGLIPYIPADHGTDQATPSEQHHAGRLYDLEVTLLSGPLSDAFRKNNPTVSRTIQICGVQTLEALHEAIFDAYDRYDEHMYEYRIGGKSPKDRNAKLYGLVIDDMFDDHELAGDVTSTTLASLGLNVKQTFYYWFDFGDDWWHKITVLAIHDKVPRGRYPKVTERVGKSPPQYPDLT